MATSLLTTLSTHNIHSNRITNPDSTRVLLPSRTLSFSRSPKRPKKITNLSPPQSHVMVPSALSGSSGIETSAISEDTTTLLDTVKVFDLNGNAIPISDLWKDRKAIVAFARHFGCVFCRKRADYLASKQDIRDKFGAALVLIGPGSIDQARAFTEQTKFKGDKDEDDEGVGMAEMMVLTFLQISVIFEKLFFFINIEAGLKIIQLYMEGYRQDWKLSFQRDTVARGGWQQGGIIVAGPGKSNISYVHKDKEAGDDPDIEDILKACCS